MAKEYVDETGLDKYDQLIKNKLADDIGRTEGKITPHINSRVTDSPEGIHGLYIGDSDRIKIDPDGDGSYVNLVLPPDCGGTGCTSEQETRNSLGLGDTLGPLPIECGGTGSNSLNSIFSDLVKINEQTKYTFVHEIGNKTNVTGHQYPTKKSGPDSLPSGYYRPISFKIETTNLVSDNSYPHLRAYNTDTDLNALIPSPFNNNGDNATTFPVTWSPSEPSSNQLKNLVGKIIQQQWEINQFLCFLFPDALLVQLYPC